MVLLTFSDGTPSTSIIRIYIKNLTSISMSSLFYLLNPFSLLLILVSGTYPFFSTPVHVFVFLSVIVKSENKNVLCLLSHGCMVLKRFISPFRYFPKRGLTKTEVRLSLTSIVNLIFVHKP